jgi:flagellar motility protein MotE (MotC chaperone)
VASETKLAHAGKQIKLDQAEIASLEADISKLIKAIEEMREEQRYLQEMRGMPVDEEEDEELETEDEQFMRRVADGAEDAALFYRRLSDETRKEFKFIQEQFKLLEAYKAREMLLLIGLTRHARKVLVERYQ